MPPEVAASNPAIASEAKKDAEHVRKTLRESGSANAYNEVIKDTKEKHNTDSAEDKAYRAALTEELKANHVLPHLTISYLNDENQHLKDSSSGNISDQALASRADSPRANEVEAALAQSARGDNFKKISGLDWDWSNDITQDDIDKGLKNEDAYHHLQADYSAAVNQLLSNPSFYNQLDASGTGIHDNVIDYKNCQAFIKDAQNGLVPGTPEERQEMIKAAQTLQKGIDDDKLLDHGFVVAGTHEGYFTPKTLAQGFGYSPDEAGVAQMKAELAADAAAPLDHPGSSPEAAGPPSPPERKVVEVKGPDAQGKTYKKYDDDSVEVRDDKAKTTTTKTKDGVTTIDYDEGVGTVERRVIDEKSHSATLYNRDKSVVVTTQVDANSYTVETKNMGDQPNKKFTCDKDGNVSRIDFPDGHYFVHDQASGKWLHDGDPNQVRDFKNSRITFDGVNTWDDMSVNPPQRHKIGTDGVETHENLDAAEAREKAEQEQRKANGSGAPADGTPAAGAPTESPPAPTAPADGAPDQGATVTPNKGDEGIAKIDAESAKHEADDAKRQDGFGGADAEMRKAINHDLASLEVERGSGYYQVAEKMCEMTGKQYSPKQILELAHALRAANSDRSVLIQHEHLNLPYDSEVFQQVQADIAAKRKAESEQKQ